MAVALIALGGLLGIVGLAGYVWLLVEAFKMDVVQGLLCLCVPCYNLYFAFARLESRSKGAIIGLWLGAGIPAFLLYSIGTTMLAAASP